MTELKFEHALEKLEKIVSDMESGELSLDDSLKKYEEGIKLSRFCSKKLKEAEKKIEILIKDSDGNMNAEPFDSENYEAAPPKKSPSKSPTKPIPPNENKEDDEDLLF